MFNKLFEDFQICGVKLKFEFVMIIKGRISNGKEGGSIIKDPRGKRGRLERSEAEFSRPERELQACKVFVYFKDLLFLLCQRFQSMNKALDQLVKLFMCIIFYLFSSLRYVLFIKGLCEHNLCRRHCSKDYCNS